MDVKPSKLLELACTELVERVRETLRTRHYSYRTEQAYLDWIKRFIIFHNKRHPRDMSAEEVQAYITYLANECRVAASTQNPCTEPACGTQCCRSEALSAIVFLYRYVLQKEINLPSDILRPGRSERLPTVLSHQEAMLVISRRKGTLSQRVCLAVRFSLSQPFCGSGFKRLKADSSVARRAFMN
jgi:hypothetical protein